MKKATVREANQKSNLVEQKGPPAFVDTLSDDSTSSPIHNSVSRLNNKRIVMIFYCNFLYVWLFGWPLACDLLVQCARRLPALPPAPTPTPTPARAASLMLLFTFFYSHLWRAQTLISVYFTDPCELRVSS